MTTRRWWPAAPALLLAGAVGCGPRTYPATGRVVWEDGSPATEMAGGMVELRPVAGGIEGARGDIAPDGGFRLVTPPYSGMFPGDYQALVVPPWDVLTEKELPSPIARKYERFDSSGLQFTVQPAENVFEVKVERRKANPRRKNAAAAPPTN
jgi:hypothetical protein